MSQGELRVRSKINSDFAGGYLACWRGARCFRTGTRAYSQRSVRSEQRSQQAKEPQPGGAGGVGPSASLLVGHSPTLGDAPRARAEAPRASHLARRRSRQNRKLFLNEPLSPGAPCIKLELTSRPA